MTLPSWLSRNAKGQYIIDTDVVYPQVLNLLKLPKDQYGVEVAYQCAKMAAQDAISMTTEDPRQVGKTLELMAYSSSKSGWALAGLPEGRGWMPATKGKEAIAHYETIKSKLLV
jgi:hypothetical protein